MTFKKKLIYSLLTISVIIVFLEGVLWVACLISQKVNLVLSKAYTSASVPDDMLQYRPNPAYLEHDSKGFRNKTIPVKVDIVCIGDSQTYGSGVGVNREEAWPQQLEKLSGETTYNMAFGSYGPSHYLMLSDEALAMKPSVIIATLYAGNDLYDVFNMVYTRNKLSYLKSADQNVISAIDRLEKENSLLSQIEHPDAGGKSTSKIKHACIGVSNFISNHSKIFGVFRALGRLTVNNKTLGSIAGFLQHPFSAQEMVYDKGKFRTVFTLHERMLALDLNDIRIKEGLRIALESLSLINEKAKKNNTVLYVLLIPTKEQVFKELVLRDWKTVPEDYRTLMDNEESVFKQAIKYLRDRDIPYFDALPALRGCLNEGKQPYSVTSDGHPNANGYNAIARLIYKAMLNKVKWTE